MGVNSKPSLKLLLVRATAFFTWGLTAFSSIAGTAPVIHDIAIKGEALQLNITADAHSDVTVEACTNLSLGVWEIVTNVSLLNTNWNFTCAYSPGKPTLYYRVAARSTPPVLPEGMVLIPAGDFNMGDEFSEGPAWEVPVHSVYVSAVYIDQYEVTKGLWDSVMTWAQTNGYTFQNRGAGKGPTHPVQSIDWYDMVKWCNARSEMQGMVPAYYTGAERTQVFKAGESAPFVKWDAGYRLPTEAEWEKASRGGVDGHRFPWSNSDTISHTDANYFSDSSYAYDVSPTRGFHPAFDDGVMPFTSPVGSFPPNGYGLYDTAGNVWEWCWDYAGPYPSEHQTDPHGPDVGDTRVGRGGNWNYYAEHCRNGYRYGNNPTYTATNIGFRCAMSAPGSTAR